LLDTAAAVNLNTDAQRTYTTMLRILNTEQAAKRQDYMTEEDSSKIDEKIKAYH
jgi:hypothetical protein